ncbi:uncharacterized protein LOC122962533 [Acropora millepora]|uniref:uncharacterized protein LOC122962533 n=1 Tax=Acropora millepora TaxID=45264 RepID=UPI001CF4B174|nr:uncharacterized protein LOC122962533 [Acropora millepora]
METCSKPNVKALSIAQIVISVAFFLLGIVDGLFIKDIYVSFIFLPCWVGALVLPVGLMGLRLTSYQRPRTLQLLKHAIWSLCVACIICSAVITYIYTTRGLLIIQYHALTIKNIHWLTRKDVGLFVAEGDKMVYTEKKKKALAFFTFVIICNVIEIVLAAAMMKICKTPRLSSSSSGYYQMGDSQQSPQAYPIEQQQISATQQSLQADPAVEQRVHVDFRDNQASYNDVMNH